MSVTNTQENAVSQQTEAAAATAGRLDVLEQLTKPEIQESLTVLIENLPKITQMVTQLTKAYDFVNTAMHDPILVDDMKHGLGGFVKPVAEKAKGVAAAAIEAKERAAANSSTIGIFGLLNMLKDPQVQQVLRFSQAFLDVTSERKNQR
jgi:uncharacterized protein YjgD (DUF1641 family)